MLRFHRPPNQVPTSADLAAYQQYPWAVLEYKLQEDYEVVDRTRWCPHRFEVTSSGKSPFCRKLERGLYTNSDEFAQWLNERYIPALAKINAAFSGNDATTSRLPTVEHLKEALQLLCGTEPPPEAKDVAVAATESYAAQLRGAIYFVLAYNLDPVVIEHRACAISAAMHRPPFSTMADGDPGHRAMFDAIGGLVVQYVHRMEQDPNAASKRWLPWTVPSAGSGTVDRKEGISVALGIARTCRWTADVAHFETQARMWQVGAMPDTELRSKLAEWVANCYQKHKAQVECIEHS